MAAEGEPWRCIAYDISATGIGIVLPFHLRLGTGLQIEPSGLPGAGALRARLVHSRPVDFVWFCGCEFFSRLDDAELRAVATEYQITFLGATVPLLEGGLLIAAKGRPGLG